MNRKQRRAAAKLKEMPRGSLAAPAAGMEPAGIGEQLTAGRKLHEAGNLAAAEVWYRRVLTAEPNNDAALHMLGVLAHQTGRHRLAIELIGQAIQRSSTNPAYYSDFGNALAGEGRLDEAVSAYRQAIKLKPDFATAHSNLGVAFERLGKFGEAVVAHRRATSISPGSANAHFNLGVALEKLGELDQAVVAYRSAISIVPNHADANCNLGVALQGLGRLEEAIAAYRRAISVKPDKATAHANLGVALQEYGELSDARNSLEKAIDLEPRNALNYRLLGEVKRFSTGDPHVAAMERLAGDLTSLSSEEQIDLHFALGKAYGDLGEHERSFRHLLEGNTLKRRCIVYDERATLALFDRIRAVFTGELIRIQRGFGHPSTVPVFIIGMPRSGTTLVEQILASHPQVFGSGELEDMRDAARQLGGAEGTAARFPEAVPSMTGDELYQFGARYIDALCARAPKAGRITDKMPMNYLFAGLIHLALPNARIIHTRRDPIDTCLSCFSKLFTRSNTYSYDLAELGRYYRGYEALMVHWRTVLPPGVMLEVQYESLTDDLAGEARRIVAHCGLEWNDACLSFYKAERPVRTASAAQVRQPIYRSSIGRWRSYEHLLGPLIEALDIDLASGLRRNPSVLPGDGQGRGDVNSAGALLPSVPVSGQENSAHQDLREAPRTQIVIDAIEALTIRNGVLRVDCVAAGPDGGGRPSGTLLIPGNQAGQLVRSLVQAVQELGKMSARAAPGGRSESPGGNAT
jgi:Flp pilus assembly protein TadD